MFDKLKAKVKAWLSASKFFDSKSANDYLKKVFESTYSSGDIPAELFNENFKSLSKAVDEGFGTIEYGSPNYEFKHQLKSNIAVFSAFKSHEQNFEMVEALTDENGKLRSFNEYKKATSSINNKYNERWLEAEYNIAVKSARAAEQWKDIESTKDLYPNLEYIPSRAAEPREDHKKYYGMIRSVDDPVWDNIMPPNGYGCECSVQKTRKDADEGEIEVSKPAKGIAGNAGKTAQVFTPEHPYVENTSTNEKGVIMEKASGMLRTYIRDEVKNWAFEKLDKQVIKNSDGQDFNINRTCLKELINQPHKFYRIITKKMSYSMTWM